MLTRNPTRSVLTLDQIHTQGIALYAAHCVWVLGKMCYPGSEGMMCHQGSVRPQAKIALGRSYCIWAYAYKGNKLA